MDSFLETLANAQNEDADPSDVTNALLSIPDQIDYKFLSVLETKEVEKTFTEVWKFLLYSANSNQSSIRLTAYRSTGIFLLKTTPYYPRQIQGTFSDIAMQSTIDIKSSAILASSFAFIANLVPLHQLEKFLDTTPVFHHFTISDPIFSEHLASIIAKLKRLGIEWMQTLLHSFLTKISMKSDRFLFKSLAAIITHFPTQLIKEVIQFVCEQENPTKHIPLISFIFSTVQNLNPKTVDLSDIAYYIMDILQHPDDHIQSELDSSFQIYSLRSDSFTVTYEYNDTNELKIICTTEKGSREAVLDITKFKHNPSFYSMKLPFQFLKPTSDDGMLITSAKINTLKLVAVENQEEYLNILTENIGERYDDKIAACCQSLAGCINDLKPTQQLRNVFCKLVFAKQSSWFHSLNIIKLISFVKGDTAEALLSQRGVDRIINLLIDLCFNVNESVSAESPKVLAKFLRPKDINNAILLVARGIDVYDEDKFMRSISLLTFLIKNHEEVDMNYLHYLINIIIEAFPLYKGTVASISAIFNFLSLFDLSFLDINIGRKLSRKAINISNAYLEMLTGISAENQNVKVKQYLEMIDDDIASRNFDIISGTSLEREEFLCGLIAAVRLLIVMPTESVEVYSALHLAESLTRVIPYEAAKLYNKIWSLLPETEQIATLDKISSPLLQVKDFGPIAIWSELLLTKYSKHASKLTSTRDVLHKLSYYALCHPEIASEKALINFARFESIVVRDIGTIIPVVEKIPEEKKNKILRSLYDKYRDCYDKLQGEKPPPEVKEEEKFEIEVPKLEINYDECPTTDFTDDFNSPFILTQLRAGTFEFKEETLNALLKYYCATYNKPGIRTLFYYAKQRQILLNFDDVVVPESFVVLCIQYLKSVKAPICHDFALESLLKYGGRDIAIATAACMPATFIKDLTEERITKKAITFVSMAIQKIPLKPEMIFNFVIECLTQKSEYDEIPPKRFATGICLACLACALIPTIPPKWSDDVMDLIAKREDSPLLLKVRFASLKASKTPKTDKLLDYVKNKLSLDCSARSIEMFYVYQALWYLDPKSKLMNNLHEPAQHLLLAELPSLFSCGIRLLNMSFTRTSNDQKADKMLRQNLLATLSKFTKFIDIPMLPEYFVLFLTNVMNRSTIPLHHKLILKSFDTIIPPASSASFPAMSICLPKMIAIADPTNDVLKKMTAFSLTLLTSPGSLFLLKVNLSITREESQKSKSDQGSDTIVLDRATEFLSHAADIDGASMTDIIYEYIVFITQCLGMTDGLQFVILQFHKYIKRFFTLYIALARFLKRSKLLSDDVKERDKEATLTNLDFLISVLPHKCHARAVECLKSGEHMREAIKLASFEEDCEESDEIIKQIFQ